MQDTCERALRFRYFFREGTNLRAWVLTIMRHHFLDMAKRTRDAMVSGKGVPLEESPEWVHSKARAEEIRFAKEALALAGAGLSEEQACVFWLILAPTTLKECAALGGVPKGMMATRLHRARSFAPRLRGLMEEDWAWLGCRCAAAQRARTRAVSSRPTAHAGVSCTSGHRYPRIARVKAATAGEKRRPAIDTSETSRTTSGSASARTQRLGLRQNRLDVAERAVSVKTSTRNWGSMLPSSSAPAFLHYSVS